MLSSPALPRLPLSRPQYVEEQGLLCLRGRVQAGGRGLEEVDSEVGEGPKRHDGRKARLHFN